MLQKHYVARLTTNASRLTAVDPSACLLFPGGLGQWVAEALQLSTTVPYLLLWCHVMGVEGTPPAHYLTLLEALGYLPKFRWTAGGQGRRIVCPVSLDISCETYLL